METIFDARHYRSAIKERNEIILNHVSDFANTTMLELGAGIGLPGKDFEQLGCKVTSVEGRKENVEEGKRRFPEREWLNLDLNIDPIPTGYDFILCLGLLYHLSNPENLIQQFHVRTFISTIVIDSDDPNLLTNVTSLPPARNTDHHLVNTKGSRFSYTWLEKYLKSTGLEVVDITPDTISPWCYWLHRDCYLNDGEFRRRNQHCRKMYMCK
jgi:hypothetical protein